MPAVGGGDAYPELRATGLDAIEVQGREYAEAAPFYDNRERIYRQAAFELEESSSGAFIDEAVIAHHMRAAKHRDRAEVYRELAKLSKKVAEYGHSMNSRLDLIHNETQAELAAAGVVTPAVHEAIIAAGHTRAVTAHNDFAAAVERSHVQTAARVSPLLTHILGTDQIPTDKRDTTQALDDKTASRGSPKPDGRPQEPPDTTNTADRGSPATKGPPQDPTRTVAARGDGSGSDQAAGNPPGTASRGDGEMPSVIPAMSPRSPFGAPQMGGGGMPGGGLLGGSNPLSSLMSGFGEPGATPAGLSGLANGSAAPGAAAQAAQMSQSPASAIARSLAAGTGGGGAPLAPLSPPTTTGAGSVTGMGGASAVPPAAGASGVAPSSGLGAAGTHVAPAAGPVSSASSAAAPAPAMMVPPPGMGAPAAAMSAGSSAAPVAPASTAGNSSGAGGGAGTAGGVVPGAGATAVVPAGVVRVSAAAGGRNESQELRTARTVAAQLRRHSDVVYPLIEWSVGVFRSDSSATTETVVMSSEGFGYVPWGLFLPRGVRLLSTDPLVKTGFEKRWKGWPDPARVLVEYATLRQEQVGGRLVAAAATNRVEPFKTAGVEYALCVREKEWQLLPPPVLDAVHVGRFEVTYPDLSVRVQRLCAADHHLLDGVVRDLAGRMMQGVIGTVAAYPVELRDLWDRLSANEPVSEQDWGKLVTAGNGQFLQASLCRPSSVDDDPAEDQTGENNTISSG